MKNKHQPTWYEKNKDTEKYKARKRKYNQIDYYRRRTKRLLYEREKRMVKRKELMTKLGGEQCIKCGFNDYRALQFDHIEGGGTKQRREMVNVWPILKHIENNLSEYQVLCANCNWIKRLENNECARTRKEFVIPPHLKQT